MPKREFNEELAVELAEALTEATANTFGAGWRWKNPKISAEVPTIIDPNHPSERSGAFKFTLNVCWRPEWEREDMAKLQAEANVRDIITV